MLSVTQRAPSAASRTSWIAVIRRSRMSRVRLISGSLSSRSDGYSLRRRPSLSQAVVSALYWSDSREQPLRSRLWRRDLVSRLTDGASCDLLDKAYRSVLHDTAEHGSAEGVSDQDAR